MSPDCGKHDRKEELPFSMLPSWDSLSAEHGIRLHPSHGDTPGLPVSLITHVGHTAIRATGLTSLFLCQAWAAWSPPFCQEISAVSRHFVLILWGLPHLPFKYSHCPSFSPSFVDFAETYSSKPGVLALVQAREQGLTSPIRPQGSLRGSQAALH